MLVTAKATETQSADVIDNSMCPFEIMLSLLKKALLYLLKNQSLPLCTVKKFK